MRVEPRIGLRGAIPRLTLAAATTAFACGMSSAAHAQDGLSARLAIQFQRVEQDGVTPGAAGPAQRFTTTRSLWLQTYEVNHAARIGQRLRVLSQFRLTELDYVDRPEGSRQPYGSLRMVHPFFGVTGTHRPTTTTGSFIGRGFAEGSADSLAARQTTTRDRETALLGYLSIPRAPRLDVSWIRRSREADLFSSGGAGVTRSARASYEVGPLRVNGGYQDLVRDDPGPGDAAPDQRSLNGGAGLRLAPSPTSSLDLSYDVFETRRGLEGKRDNRSRSQIVNLAGSARPSAKTTWTTQYGYRRSDVEAGADTSFDDHNAALTLTHAPIRAVQLTGSGGMQTQRLANRADLVRYASALAGFAGAVRRGWQASASASHTSNWSDARGAYSIQILRAGSVFELRRELRLRADAEMSANGDSAARGQGATGAWTAGIEASPWRALRTEIYVRRYQTGPRLLAPRARSSSESIRLQWQPLAALQLMGYLSRTGALPHDNPRLTTRQLSVRWEPASAMQLTGSYVQSEQTSTFAVAQQLSGREIYSLQVSAALGRATRLSAGFSAADPETDRASRQYDVTLTRRFGT